MLYRHISQKISTKFCGILRALVSFTDLPELHGFTTARNITSPELRHLHYKNWRLKNLHLATIFLQLFAKRQPEDFLISSPACLVTLACVAGKISSLFAVVFRCRQEDWEHSASQIEILLALIVHFPTAIACSQDFDGTPL